MFGVDGPHRRPDRGPYVPEGGPVRLDPVEEQRAVVARAFVDRGAAVEVGLEEVDSVGGRLERAADRKAGTVGN